MNPEVTNVFFTQGQLDPWRPMGLQEDLNSQSPVVVIPSRFFFQDNFRHFNYIFRIYFSAFTLF